jgi:mevalonate kinase
MPAISASAPGKIILFGEHAVVYHRPAIAVPVLQVHFRAALFADPLAPAHTVWIDAPDIGLSARLEDLEPEHPIRFVFQQVMKVLNLTTFPSARVSLTSTIPLGSGLGSSSASAVALTRAISTFLGRPFPDDIVNRIAFETEKIHHGHPSGIDNTVITYEKPIFFVKDQPIEWLELAAPLHLVIADSGHATSTAEVVEDVHRHWTAQPDVYPHWFDEIGECAIQARFAMKTGNVAEIGAWTTRNHELLQKLNVSSDLLDTLVRAALKADALGAKLSGSGRGGNMIALVANEAAASAMAKILASAGAVRTLITTVPATLKAS